MALTTISKFAQVPIDQISMSTLTATSTVPTDMSVVDMRCSYSARRCPFPRTSKKGGGLHRYCEFHRLRANQNQWRVDHKRRTLRALQRQQVKTSKAFAKAIPGFLDPVDLSSEGASFSGEDILLLEVLLFECDTVDAETPPACQVAQSQAFCPSIDL